MHTGVFPAETLTAADFARQGYSPEHAAAAREWYRPKPPAPPAAPVFIAPAPNGGKRKTAPGCA